MIFRHKTEHFFRNSVIKVVEGCFSANREVKRLKKRKMRTISKIIGYVIGKEKFSKKNRETKKIGGNQLRLICIQNRRKKFFEQFRQSTLFSSI